MEGDVESDNAYEELNQQFAICQAAMLKDEQKLRDMKEDLEGAVILYDGLKYERSFQYMDEDTASKDGVRCAVSKEDVRVSRKRLLGSQSDYRRTCLSTSETSQTLGNFSLYLKEDVWRSSFPGPDGQQRALDRCRSKKACAPRCRWQWSFQRGRIQKGVSEP